MQTQHDRSEKEMDKPERSFYDDPLSKIMNLIIDAIKIRGLRPSVVAAGQESEKRNLDKARSVLMKWLSVKDEVLQVKQAFNLIVTNPTSSADVNKIYEILKAREEELTDITPEDSYRFDSIKDWLGISKETFHLIYVYGCQLLKQNQIKESLVIFALLTLIDQYQFEPWLFLGMSYELTRDFFEAVCIFAMASLIDLKNPVPHLHAAGIYIQAGKQELARQTLELCLQHITPEGKVEYRKIISDLKRQIYFQKWAHELLAPEKVSQCSREFKANKQN